MTQADVRRENLQAKILETLSGPEVRMGSSGLGWFKVWVGQAVVEKGSVVPEMRKDAVLNLVRKLEDQGIRGFNRNLIKVSMTWEEIEVLAESLWKQRSLR